MATRHATLSIVIPLVAVILLVGCNTALQSTALPPTATPDFRQPEMQPPTPPSWGPMPTRMPSPTPTLVTFHPLQTLQAALQRGAYDTASLAWERSHNLAPDDGIVWREGARLALAQGNVLSTTGKVLTTTTSALSDNTMDSVALAETRIWRAIELIPQDGKTWALLGLILKKQNQLKAAAQALDIARTLDPTLGAGLFPELWQTALQAQDTQTLQNLVRTYSREYRDSPLAIYYRAETLLALGETEVTRDLLIASIERQDSSPAILWYTLGRTYMRLQAWNEAAMSLEVAKRKTTSGDMSLHIKGETTLNDLNLSLGLAYLRAGQCAQAEQTLRSLKAQATLEIDTSISTPYPDLTSLVRQAVVCQTPTPTWTPWMISEQVIPTP